MTQARTPRGRTYPVGTINQIALIPVDVLPRFIKELPHILSKIREIDANIDELAARIRAKAPMPQKLLPTSTYAKMIRKGLETGPTWTDDGERQGTVTLQSKDGRNLSQEKLDEDR